MDGNKSSKTFSIHTKVFFLSISPCEWARLQNNPSTLSGYQFNNNNNFDCIALFDTGNKELHSSQLKNTHRKNSTEQKLSYTNVS